MKTRFPKRLCTLAAAIVLIGVALFTGGCAVGYDDYYGGGVYDYGYGGPFYGGYYGSYYGGGYYGGGGYYPSRPGYNPGGPRPSHPISGVGPGNSYVRPTPHGGGGGYRGGGGGRGGGGRR